MNVKLIDVERLLENVNDKNVEETLKILLEKHRKKIIKSLQLIQIYVELDRLKEACDALSIFMDEFLGDFHEKILKIFKMYFLKGQSYDNN